MLDQQGYGGGGQEAYQGRFLNRENDAIQEDSRESLESTPRKEKSTSQSRSRIKEVKQIQAEQ